MGNRGGDSAGGASTLIAGGHEVNSFADSMSPFRGASSRVKHSLPQEITPGSSTSLPLDQFEVGNLSFSLTLTQDKASLLDRGHGKGFFRLAWRSCGGRW
jgi:hypothetical protein